MYFTVVAPRIRRRPLPAASHPPVGAAGGLSTSRAEGISPDLPYGPRRAGTRAVAGQDPGDAERVAGAAAAPRLGRREAVARLVAVVPELVDLVGVIALTPQDRTGPGVVVNVVPAARRLVGGGLPRGGGGGGDAGRRRPAPATAP